MSRTGLLLAGFALLGLGFVLIGCNRAPKAPPPETLKPAQPLDTTETPEESPKAAEAPKKTDKAAEGSDKAATDKQSQASPKVEQALAELSKEDRAAAEKQKLCPVSGNLLGSMGTPCKVTVKDQVVFLCCPGCEGKIKENPDKYLAKLGK